MKCKYIVGIDEVGRGCLAGPLVLGAVCLGVKNNKNYSLFLKDVKGVKDSKKLSPEQRVIWCKKLKTLQDKHDLRLITSRVRNTTIDKIGLTESTNRVIKKLLDKLELKPETCLILLDGGLRARVEYKNQKTIIRGDEKEPIIALASIIAKVCRDKYMVKCSKKICDYGFEIHKGYGTKAHYKAIKNNGISYLHRRTFLKKLI